MKYLIAGLGNIGSEYENTRHNIGFKVLDALAKASNLVFENDKLAHVTKLKFKGRTLVLIKPTTFMNLSGKAVNYWLQKEKISSDKLLVITDDIALPFGTVRLRAKGSDGGHNGLKDIQQHLNTAQYPRLRFGVGAEFSRGSKVDYVLGEWTIEERACLQERILQCCNIIQSFSATGLQLTMSEFNNK